MAAPVRFDALRESVRVLAKLPDFDDSPPSPVTLTEVNAYINAAVRRYYGLLLKHRIDEYCTFEELVSTSGASYSLASLTAARFHDVRKVHWVRGVNDVVEVLPATSDQWHLRSESSVTWDRGTDARYQLVRGLLYLLPVPAASVSLRLWYVGIPADLVEDEDEIDGGPGWEDFVTADVCLHIANSQEEDEGRWQNMLAQATGTILDQKKRQRTESKQVRDTRGVRPETRLRRRMPWVP